MLVPTLLKNQAMGRVLQQPTIIRTTLAALFDSCEFYVIAAIPAETNPGDKGKSNYENIALHGKVDGQEYAMSFSYNAEDLVSAESAHNDFSQPSLAEHRFPKVVEAIIATFKKRGFVIHKAHGGITCLREGSLIFYRGNKSKDPDEKDPVGIRITLDWGRFLGGHFNPRSAAHLPSIYAQ